MKELFLNYELSLLAKEYGFDEYCLAGFFIADEGQFNIIGVDTNHEGLIKNSLDNEDWLTSPLYQQMIEWFAKKQIYINIRFEESMQRYICEIVYRKLNDQTILSPGYNYTDGDISEATYYDAIQKAIEVSFSILTNYYS